MFKHNAFQISGSTELLSNHAILHMYLTVSIENGHTPTVRKEALGTSDTMTTGVCVCACVCACVVCVCVCVCV